MVVGSFVAILMKEIEKMIKEKEKEYKFFTSS